jgi:ribosome-associated protein
LESEISDVDLTADEKVEIIREAMDELKALDINVMPVTEKTHLTDYMMVCSGTSNTHIRSIADHVLETMKEHDIKGVRREGYAEARWILMDFGDVIVHVFDPEDRKFYRLEDFWDRDVAIAAIGGGLDAG